MNQRGFISLSLTGYIALGSLAVITLVSGYAYIQTKRLEACKAEHRAFVSEVERLGLEAKEKAKKQEAQDKLKKEKADAELKKLRSANAEFKRLRDSDTHNRRLPEAPRETPRPDLACFDRSSLESAYGELVKGLRGLADEGTENTLRLKSAVDWAAQ
jgi:hypothetical protein